MNDILSALTASSADTTLTLASVFTTMLLASISGLVIGFSYLKTGQCENTRKDLVITLFMLPIIMGVIILFVGSNVARAFSLAGTVSIIRFRSTQGAPKDIGYIFFATAAGLCCGMGYGLYGLLFVFVLCAVLYLLDMAGFGKEKECSKVLKITVPEEVNFRQEFSEILKEFTTSARITAVKTADLGSVFVVTYSVVLKNDCNEKTMLDKIRCHNSNLTILLTEAAPMV